jgi:signal transduction histidine kinase/ligand-binding sensor domain-containing protein/DNA-binding response OmpR family regulator
MKLIRNISVGFLVFFICGFGNSLSGQLRNSLFNNYSINEGLFDNVIHCIFQDSKGWIWIGTSSGILKFDGYSFVKLRFNSSESEVLGTALVRTIYEDRNGVLWIGTENQGIFLYDRRQYGLTQIKHLNKRLSLPNNSIWAITEDEYNNIWIGTEEGLVCYNQSNENCQIYNNSVKSDPRISNNFIRAIYADINNNIWIGTNEGVDLLNIKSKVCKNYLKYESYTERENEVWKIYKSHDGQIWVGTYLDGLKRYNKKTDKFEGFELTPDNERARTVRAIVEDNSGNLWIGTRGGLYSVNLENHQTSHFEHDNFDPNGLIHNSILEIFKDKKGDLWIGTRDGISYLNFDKQAFGYLSTNIGSGNYMNSNEVYTFWEDEKSNIWIGTDDGGINIYHPQKGNISYLTKSSTLSSNCIKSLCPDGKGNLLVGTYLGGLNQINLQTGATKFYFHDARDHKSISGNAVWSIARDHKNQIWIGTDGGVDLFDPITGNFNHFGDKYGVQNVVLVYVDTKNRLWLYYENVKLTMIDKGSIRNFPYKARLIFDDGDNIWLGTMGNGLIKVNIEKNEFKTISAENGLISNFIYGILPFNNKFLWLSTKNGLSRFNKETNLFTNYSIADGLLNEQFNYGAYLLCHDGTLIFGGKKGVDFIFANKIRESTYNPNVVFTDFKIFNRSVPISEASDKDAILTNLISETSQVRIPYSQNIVTFEFSALNYSNSLKNIYSYKLEGFNSFWNDVRNQRTATYTNLEPGEYTLIVRGSNNDGIFSKKTAQIKLIVLPPFYKTWLFRIFIFIVLIVLGYSIYIFISNREKLKHQLVSERQSARKMQELERLKHQFFMNISHEIRTPLSLIVGPLEKIANSDMNKSAILSHLDLVKRNATNLMKLVNQLLDYRKLETGNIQLELKNGDISDFIKDAVYTFRNMASEKKIELKFRTMHKGMFTYFDPDKIEKIVNNLVSNAIKFTDEGGTVSVNLSIVFIDEIDEDDLYIPSLEKSNIKVKQFVQISVSDTGIGIPSNQIEKIFNRFLQISNKSNKINTGSGIGLNLTKELVKIHNGYIKVKSKEGKGSKFIVLIPYTEDSQVEVINQLEDESNFKGFQTDPITESAINESEFFNSINQNIPILLIADDNADIRTFIKYHFEPSYQVIDSLNGQEAWEKALNIIPDIIIADIMMPIMNGYELCRKIKNDERTSHIPVVILTALSSKEKQISGIDVGADDYITKPFDISLLKAKIDNILSIRKALRERYSKEVLLKPKDISLASPDEKFLKRVISVIEKNMSNAEFDIDNFANLVGVSRTQLYRKIAALTDMSAKEFVRDIRLKRAVQLLIQEKLSITDIALEVGFNDINYFRKCFKDKFGSSASEYLKNAKKNAENGLI